jgi:hypothetical protein
MEICYKLGFALFIQTLFIVQVANAYQSDSNRITENSKLVIVNDGTLFVEGVAHPLIYGAEIQYFRLRGGAGKNIAKKTVIELWNKVLDRVVEAGMNAVSISIPWDFHEYSDGKFDFDGNVDEDNDGYPDYPSRDLKTFFRLVENHNIKTIMVKPGPYIKSDWGFTGIGAVPLWFHEKYSDSHMLGSDGLRNKLFDYFDDYFQSRIRLWYQALYREVLFAKIGPGKPIKFVQLDNETNFAGQSILQVDYSAKSIKRYQNFLKERYQVINGVNRNQGTNYPNFESIKPPITANENRGRLRDWYDFLDYSTGVYLEKLRRNWESLGVDENQIMFTTAENYLNSEFSLLPNSIYRNNATKTALMTANLYPKTYYSFEDSLLNYPFKADFDTKNAGTSSQAYFGYKNPWVMGSEVEFGWKKNAYVTEPAKKQIILGVLGQGMKALFVQYFADGWNWQWDWVQKQAQLLKKELKFTEPLTDDQWALVQSEFEKRIFTGIDLKSNFLSSEKENSVLNYDGAIDINGNAKEHFQLLKTIGQKIVRPYGLVLGSAKAMEDNVAVWRDTTAHAPSLIPEISSGSLGMDWSGGLLAMLIQGKIHPAFAMKSVDYTPMTTAQVIFSIDGGSFDANTALNVLTFLRRGGTWVNFLGISLLRLLNYNPVFTKIVPQSKFISLNYVNIISPAIEVPVLNAPIYSYSPPANCRNYLTWKGKTMAFICNIEGGTFIQMGTLLFEDFNNDSYVSPSLSQSKTSRMAWLDNLMREKQVSPLMRWASDGQAVSAVSRFWELDSKTGYWVTLRSSERSVKNVRLIFPNVAELIKPGMAADFFLLTEVLSGVTRQVTLKDLKDVGIVVSLQSQGSEVLSITPVFK